MIKADLALLGIHHDRVLVRSRAAGARASPTRPRPGCARDGLVYDGVLEAPKGETPEDWEPVELPLFRSTKFGDDQDRPIRKSDGSWTYFGADLAYHLQKAQSADELIDIWGADHAGTVKRIKAAVAALTDGQDAVRRQAGPDGPAAARRRAGEDVQALGQFRHARRCRARKSARTSSASPC